MHVGKKAIRTFVLTVFVVGGMLPVCQADVPQLMNYQARLTDTGGTPLNGTHDLRFRIYDAASGGSALWSEVHSGVTITNGYVNLLLGGIAAFPAGLFTDPDLYLGVRVDTDPEMSPRSRLVSVPYAFQAERAQGLVGSPGECFAAPNPPLSESFPGVGITDTLTVSGGPASITNVTCTIDLNPGGEILSLTLQSPDGTHVTLIDYGWGSVVATFDIDRFPEVGTMDDFNGETANGVWTLDLVTGTGASEPATLNSWSLCFNEGPCTLCRHTIGQRLDLSALTADVIRLPEGSTTPTIELSAPDAAVSIGGNGSFGQFRVRTATNGITLSAVGSGVTIGGSGNPGSITIMGGVASTFMLRGSNGSMDMNGDLLVKGDLQVNGAKSALVKTDESAVRAVYSDESAEVYLFDRGRGKLVNGRATIPLDPVFLQTVTVNARHPLWVQITPTGPCNGVYVKETTADGFTVEELLGGRSGATFNWEVGAKRRGYEDRRLETIRR